MSTRERTGAKDKLLNINIGPQGRFVVMGLETIEQAMYAVQAIVCIFVPIVLRNNGRPRELESEEHRQLRLGAKRVKP